MGSIKGLKFQQMRNGDKKRLSGASTKVDIVQKGNTKQSYVLWCNYNLGVIRCQK